MDEYIEREAAIKAIEKADYTLIANDADSCKADYLREIIESVPAADAVPVVHGRWVDRIVDENEVIQPWMKRYYCSECLEGGNQSWFKFCPHCGAKMDGGKKDG